MERYNTNNLVTLRVDLSTNTIVETTLTRRAWANCIWVDATLYNHDTGMMQMTFLGDEDVIRNRVLDDTPHEVVSCTELLSLKASQRNMCIRNYYDECEVKPAVSDMAARFSISNSQVYNILHGRLESRKSDTLLEKVVQTDDRRTSPRDREIAERYLDGDSVLALSQAYGLSEARIREILTGKNVKRFDVAIEVDPAELCRAYEDTFYDIEAVASAFHIPTFRVYDILQVNGYPDCKNQRALIAKLREKCKTLNATAIALRRKYE